MDQRLLHQKSRPSIALKIHDLEIRYALVQKYFPEEFRLNPSNISALNGSSFYHKMFI
mgnify:CR=1 FL=1